MTAKESGGENMAKLHEGEQIDLNTATVDQVASIPNIGMQSARALTAARPETGFEDLGPVGQAHVRLGQVHG
jgi:DNA uptake protein ComE-like DNA-binding protein